MQKSINTKGYSLVEVLVAVAILMLAIVGPMTIAAKSLQSAQYARQQNTAFFLAQEGISIMNTIRNDDGLEEYIEQSTNPWEWVDDPALDPCFTATGCNIDFRDETLLNNIVDCSDSVSACTLLFDDTLGRRAVYQLELGEPTPYTRVIKLETTANPDEVKVTSEVSWGSALLSGDQTIKLNTSLFNLYK